MIESLSAQEQPYRLSFGATWRWLDMNHHDVTAVAGQP